MAKQGYILTLFATDVTQIWETLHHQMYDSGKLAYLGSQLEVCPETNRIHWQAFAWFTKANKQRGSWFKKYHKGIHFQAITALKAQAINYGTKDDTRMDGIQPIKSGIPPQADGEDWEQLQKAVKENDRELVPFKLLVRYNLEKRFDDIRKFAEIDQRIDLPDWLPNPWGKLLNSAIKDKKRHYWIYSRQPNLGKTYWFAKPLAEKYKVYLHVGNFTYWSCLRTDRAVVLDEYNTAALAWNTLNAMCDGTYQYRAIYSKPFTLDNPLIIILSNQSISDLYPHMNQFLYARFIEIELH